jgi:hypothetical protein
MAEPEHDVVTREQGSLVAGDSTKRYKPKGAHHAFDWEALEDPNMRVEKDWKNEKEECWSSKTYKKYVKMCTSISYGLRSATRCTRRALHVGHGHAMMIISFTEPRRYGEHCLGIERKARGYLIMAWWRWFMRS